MARNVVFNFRRGGGSSVELMYGEVTLTPSMLHNVGTSAVIPAPTKFDLVQGMATATNVAPSPDPVDGKVAWAYKVKVTDRHGKSWEWLVGVPDGVPPINFVDLPPYYEVQPPAFGIGPVGPAGASATVVVGTTVSGPAPNVVNSGTSTNAILDFTLEKGEKGDKGDKGDDGVGDVQVAGFINTPGSDTRVALDAEIAAKAIPLDVFHSDNYANLAALFAAADVAGNCIIKIRPGSYTTGPLRLTKSEITINAGGANIKLANFLNVDLLALGPDAMNIHVIGGRWDGNKANNSMGHVIHFEEYVGGFRVADRSNLERCELLNAAQDAWHVGRRRVEIKAHKCQIRDAGRYGVYFGGTDCAFFQGGIGICGEAGVWNANIGNWTLNNGIYTSGVGVRLTQGSRGSFVVGNMIDVNMGHGIHVEGITAERNMDAVIEGNVFLSNSQTTTGTSSDIFLQYANAVTINANVGSRKVGITNLSKWAVEMGLGVGPIVAAGNYWEPAAYTDGIYSDPTKISNSTNRVDIRTVLAADAAMTTFVGADVEPRFRARADGALSWGVGGSTIPDVNLYRGAADQLKTDDAFMAQRVQISGTGGTGFLEMPEQTGDPGPVANIGKLYTKDDGAGKTQLCIRFGSGAVQVIATEP